MACPVICPDALSQLADCDPLVELLGERFVKVLIAVKEAEYDAYSSVIVLVGAGVSAAQRIIVRHCKTNFFGKRDERRPSSPGRG